MRVVVALGGNAIQQRDETGTAAEQRAAVREACDSIARVAPGNELIITHGNGPQVGLLLAQNEAASPRVPGMPLDILVAETQGMLGYLIQQELRSALKRLGDERPVVSVVTTVLVDPTDPAFLRPTKPIGLFLTGPAGERLKQAGIPVTDSGDGRWRRTVASPAPVAIVEEVAIRALIEAGCVPVVAGGGGVPVVAEGSGTRGLAAVIDKDRTAALLARILEADLLLILTDVEGVLVDGRTVRSLAAGHAAAGLAAGAFPEGSMGPKIEAALDARRAGIRVVIASLERAADAVAGSAGTEIS